MSCPACCQEGTAPSGGRGSDREDPWDGPEPRPPAYPAPGSGAGRGTRAGAREGDPVTAAALLADLEARDVRLWLEGGALTYDAPQGP